MIAGSSKPLYSIIEDAVKEDISEGVYKPGDLLPTEDELTRQFNASRTTVRNALSNLEKHGYIWRKQGKGSVVKEIKSEQNLNYLSSLTESLEEKGKRVTTGMMSITEVFPPQGMREEVEIGETEKVFCLQRTRVADEIPVAYVSNYIIKSIVPDLNTKKDLLLVEGLYHVLEKEYGLEIESCVETINAYISGPLEMELLHLQVPQAVFLSKRITRLADGRIFEYVKSIIRGDMHQYTVFLKNRKPAE